MLTPHDKMNLKRRSAANQPSAKEPVKVPPFQIADNRSETIQQRRLQDLANNNGRAALASQLRTRVNGSSGQMGIVQRTIMIGNVDPEEYTVDEILKEVFDQKLISDIQEADAIEEVLNTFFAEDRQFDTIAEMLKTAREELEKEDEHEESPKKDLKESDKAQINEALKHTRGQQMDVQAKMVEITRLVKGNLLDDETISYSSSVLINGLCGGWVDLFLKYPDWVEPVYIAVKSWKKPSGVSDPAALLHFEDHLSKSTKFKGAENVVKLLHDVYDAMGRVESEAGYEVPPESTDLDVGELPVSSTASDKIKTEETSYSLRNKNAAKLVCSELKKVTSAEASGECMAHIESDLHHMAVRVQKMPGKGSKFRLLITVVETEKKGIVKVNNWDEAESTLNSWLAEEESGLKNITVRVKTTGFKSE